MSLEKIRAEMEVLKSDLEIPMPEDYRYKPSHEMRIRNNTIRLEELKQTFRNRIKEMTRVYLIHAPEIDDPSPVRLNLTYPGVFVKDHNMLAERLSNFLMPSVRTGTTLSAYQIAPLNDVLDIVSEELGLMVGMRPSLSVVDKFQVAIESHSQLTKVIEGMMEHFLKNTGHEQEGQDVQAMYVAKNFVEGIETQPLSDTMINVAVLVPSLSLDLVTAYSKYFTKNLVTVSVGGHYPAELNLQNAAELIDFIGENITRPTVKSKKKVK